MAVRYIPRPGTENRSHLHRHAVHAFEDFLDILDQHKIDKADSRVGSTLHHLRHVIYRSGLEAPLRERIYIPTGGMVLSNAV